MSTIHETMSLTCFLQSQHRMVQNSFATIVFQIVFVFAFACLSAYLSFIPFVIEGDITRMLLSLQNKDHVSAQAPNQMCMKYNAYANALAVDIIIVKRDVIAGLPEISKALSVPFVFVDLLGFNLWKSFVL